MDKKIKVAVVLGYLEDFYLIRFFENFAENFEVSLFAIEYKNTLENFRSRFPIHVFEEVADTPGYMRGLESLIDGFDVIISVETSTLSTFQCVRIAEKESIPIVVMVDEYHPDFYRNFPDVKALQNEIISKCDIYLVSSESSRSMLAIEGVKEKQIRKFPPALDRDRFFYSAQKRLKFREYIGVSEKEVLIFYREDLNSSSRAKDMIFTMKILKERSPEVAAYTRLILVGEGPESEELKYLTSDLGLSSLTMFLQQDPEPFIHDLYCACDVFVSLREINPSVCPKMKRWVFDAVCCGAIPLVTAGTAEAEYLGDLGVALVDDSCTQLYDAIVDKISDRKKLNHSKVECCRAADELFSAEGGQNDFEAVLLEITDNLDSLSSQDYVKKLYLELKEEGTAPELLLEKSEDLLLRIHGLPQIRSDIMRVRGDSFFNLSKFEEATQSYGESLQLDPENWKANLGLAEISFFSHSHEEALQFYKKVLVGSPHNPEAYRGIGLVHRRVGMTDEAIYWLSKSLGYDNANEKTLVALTQACLESNNVRVPIPVLERARELIGSNPVIDMALGQLYLRDGKYEEGREMVIKALDAQQLKLPA